MFSLLFSANGDNDYTKRLDINCVNNSHNNSNKTKNQTISPKASRRRNTVSNLTNDTKTDNFVINNNNRKNSLQEEFQALQLEMCQQFKNIINQLEDKIINLEKSNRNLEIENETLSYKVVFPND